MYAFGCKARNGEYDSRRQDAEEDDCLLESRRADWVDAALGNVFRDTLILGERFLYQGLFTKLKRFQVVTLHCGGPSGFTL